ncbi:hypothetical protein MKK70_22785 [Methylobacterium sp. E-041]|nr:MULTISPECIES: hypothetical protein [unclassified Methylobacterium]MCJ2079580.1 hypothetical protein [Methylobacterium sp. E-016]MCJ2007244.1 hypothetical protein [Methylobacterium sp. J-092]MCJ2039793.1 hypothetical protein [Methylobacterium sp. J-059]MCJ2108149.1 hypothetical protein [Methylobacterium sp. E-041]MCJ2112881.1 hypothetical protein [Methylobacterium sp. E-025]
MVEAWVCHLRSLRRGGDVRLSAAALAHVAAWATLLALAGFSAWRDPAANLLPAAALAAALILDGTGRIAAAVIAGRAGPDPRLAGLPSLVLGVGGTVGLVAGAAALLVFPRAVPVLASALAGLVAIGALARLALIRIVLALPGDEPAALPAEARATSVRPPLSRR